MRFSVEADPNNNLASSLLINLLSNSRDLYARIMELSGESQVFTNWAFVPVQIRGWRRWSKSRV